MNKRIKEITERYKTDFTISIRDLAKEYNIPRHILEKIIRNKVPEKIRKKHKILTAKYKNEKFKPKEKRRLVQTYIEYPELSIGRVAKRFNVCYNTAHKIIRNFVSQEFISKRKARLCRKAAIKPVKGLGKLTADKAWILGVIHGDGNVSEKNSLIRLESGRKHTDWEFLDLWRKSLKKVYCIETYPIKSRGKITGYQTVSQLVAKELTGFGPHKSREWKVPEVIFKSKTEIQIGYIQGIFDSEGSVRKDLVASSISKRGLNGIYKLLKIFGIESSIRKEITKRKRCNNCRWYFGLKHKYCPRCKSRNVSIVDRKIYNLFISNVRFMKIFAEKINFRLSRKRKSLQNSIKSRKHIKDAKWREQKILEAIERGHKTIDKISNYLSFDKHTVGFHVRSLVKEKKIIIKGKHHGKIPMILEVANDLLYPKN